MKIIEKYMDEKNSFSKRFTKSVRNFMFVHVGVSLIACIVLAVLHIDTSGIENLLTSMMPVYIALQGANYVKSGYENGKKIMSSAPVVNSETDETGSG